MGLGSSTEPSPTYTIVNAPRSGRETGYTSITSPEYSRDAPPYYSTTEIEPYPQTQTWEQIQSQILASYQGKSKDIPRWSTESLSKGYQGKSKDLPRWSTQTSPGRNIGGGPVTSPDGAPRQTQTKTKTIYAIRSRQYWYIGSTDDVNEEWEKHKRGEGCEWTRLHLPLDEILPIREDVSPTNIGFHEDVATKMYMSKYGVMNVRGGTYSSAYLTNEQISVLEMEIEHSQQTPHSEESFEHRKQYCDTTPNLGVLSEHLKSYCDTSPGTSIRGSVGAQGINPMYCDTTPNLGVVTEHLKSYCDTSPGTSTGRSVGAPGISPMYCDRCGRKTSEHHPNSVCRWRQDRNRGVADQSKFCGRCGREGHQTVSCYAKSTYTGERVR
jgi:hypothetical protein